MSKKLKRHLLKKNAQFYFLFFQKVLKENFKCLYKTVP